MKKYLGFLALPVLISAGFVYAEYAPSGGGGGPGAGSPLGLSFGSPAEGTIFASADTDIFVQARTTAESACTFSGNVCDGSQNCKDITYRSCPFCDSPASYFTLANAYYDAVPGWKYTIQAMCRNETGSTETKKVSFSVESQADQDTNAPRITIQSPIRNVTHPPFPQLQFEVDELSHCEYTLGSGNEASHTSLPGYINNYRGATSAAEEKSYTLALRCSDLNANAAEQVLTFRVAPAGGGGVGAAPTPSPLPSPAPSPIPTLTIAPSPTPLPLPSPSPAASSLRSSAPPLRAAASFADGTLLRERGDARVWIVRGRYIRQIAHPRIFSFYLHLRWENVAEAEPGTISQFQRSALIRASGDQKVYETDPLRNQALA